MVQRWTGTGVVLTLVLAFLGSGSIAIVIQDWRAHHHWVSDPPAVGAQLGIYHGSEPDAIARYTAWLGRPPAVVGDFPEKMDTWDEVSDPANVYTWSGRPYRLVLGVPLWPSKESFDIDSALDGGYDHWYRELATRLVAHRLGNAVIRFGWEFNLRGEHPWMQHPMNFIVYWRRVVKAMRTVPGQRFSFDWNVNNNEGNLDAARYYPGNAYVDFVGVDAYDRSWVPDTYPYPESCLDVCRRSRQEAVWKYVSDSARGLRFWSDFARRRGRPMSLPEWGMWRQKQPDHGGGDDAFYVQQMYEFISDPRNNVAYAIYFDFNPPDNVHRLRDLSSGAQTYRRLFGTPEDIPAPAP